jgi:hypothetical protein
VLDKQPFPPLNRDAGAGRCAEPHGDLPESRETVPVVRDTNLDSRPVRGSEGTVVVPLGVVGS